MVDELKVVRGYVSSEFSAELDKAQQTATDHLQEAKRIMEKQAGKVARADSTKDK